jgi:hypothetical protein
MEHEAQPHQGDQYQLVKKEMGDHGKTPSYRWSNEGILPGFQAVGMSRRLEVHDHDVPFADTRALAMPAVAQHLDHITNQGQRF